MSEELDEKPKSRSSVAWVQAKFIRNCMFCGEPFEDPLKIGNLIYKFCCLEHKKAWDDGRKTVARLTERDWV